MGVWVCGCVGVCFRGPPPPKPLGFPFKTTHKRGTLKVRHAHLQLGTLQVYSSGEPLLKLAWELLRRADTEVGPRQAVV